MLQKDLSCIIPSSTAMVDSEFNIHSFEDIKKHIHSIVKMFEKIEIGEKEAVAIYNKSNYENICCIYACLVHGVNFTIIDSSDSESILYVKKPIIGVDIVLSDFYDDPYTLTINTSVMVVSSNSSPVRELSPTVLADFTMRSVEIADSFFAEKVLVYEEIELPVVNDTKLENRVCAVYHKGAIIDSYKTSVFTLDRVLKGIDHSTNNLEFVGDKVLFMEPFDLLYDVVNGVMNPLGKGIEVLFTDTSSIENLLYSCKVLRATDLYVHSYTFEKVLSLIESELPDYVRTFKANPLLSWIYQLVFRNHFFKIFGKGVKHLIITGKINRTAMINVLGLKVTTLYTMTEVTSFVAAKTHKKLKKDFSVGKVNTDNVLIVGKRANSYGGIMIFADNMAVSSLPQESLMESFINHNYKGRLWTRDIGYIDHDDELHVINKSSLIFEMDNGKLVSTGEMQEIALMEAFVKETIIVKPLGDNRRLVMLIEPNKEYAEEHSLSYEELQFKCNELRLKINSRFNGEVQLHAVKVYTDPEGITRDTFKIVSRQIEE